MRRIGINPARGMTSDYRPARVTVVLLTYLPDLSGYFADRLRVLQISISSLLAHTVPPYDLMVFDNGSCPQVIDYLNALQRQGSIDFLIRSPVNIGKIGALRVAFGAAPGEIIAYSDDDILFYPGWLEAQLEILEAFPKVGMVSGAPVRDAARHARSSLDKLAYEDNSDVKVSFERCIPDEWEADWAASTGRDPQAHLHETEKDLDMVLQIKTPQAPEFRTAIGSANHFQFVARKEILLQGLPAEWTGKLMGHMLELDDAIDQMGYLRLSTTRRYTRHIGNALSPQLMEELTALGLAAEPAPDRIKRLAQTALAANTLKPRKRSWILSLPGSRRALVWAYKRLFEILYN
jgi:glycosyltransferase involved in cell wall biosynthesis